MTTVINATFLCRHRQCRCSKVLHCARSHTHCVCPGFFYPSFSGVSSSAVQSSQAHLSCAVGCTVDEQPLTQTLRNRREYVSHRDRLRNLIASRLSHLSRRPRLYTLHCRHHHDIPATVGLQWYKGNGKKSPRHKDGARLLRWPPNTGQLMPNHCGLKMTLSDAIESRDGTGGIVKQSVSDNDDEYWSSLSQRGVNGGPREESSLMRLGPCR